MAKFVWRLQRVLEVKKKQEQAVRMEVLHLAEQVAQLRCQLLMQKQNLKNMLETVAETPPAERMNQQALVMNYAKGSQIRIKAMEDQVQALSVQKQEKTKELRVLKQTTEGLGRLKSNAKQQFIKDENRKEQKMADELTLAKHARYLALSDVSAPLARG